MEEYLNDTGSDQSPLLIDIQLVKPKNCFHFKFLDFWCNHQEFLNVVRESWSKREVLNPISRVVLRLKGLRKVLEKWRRDKYGDTFQEVLRAEDEVSRLAIEFGDGACPLKREELNAARASLKCRIATEVSYQRQKARSLWVADGDKNSKFFHACVKGCREKLLIHSISTEEGKMVRGQEELPEAAVAYLRYPLGRDCLQGRDSVGQHSVDHFGGGECSSSCDAFHGRGQRCRVRHEK